MKRKRFEKLVMGRFGIPARAVRHGTRQIIDLRRLADRANDVLVFDESTGRWKYMKIRPYAEMFDRMRKGRAAIGN